MYVSFYFLLFLSELLFLKLMGCFGSILYCFIFYYYNLNHITVYIIFVAQEEFVTVVIDLERDIVCSLEGGQQYSDSGTYTVQ